MQQLYQKIQHSVLLLTWSEEPIECKLKSVCKKCVWSPPAVLKTSVVSFYFARVLISRLYDLTVQLHRKRKVSGVTDKLSLTASYFAVIDLRFLDCTYSVHRHSGDESHLSQILESDTIYLNLGTFEFP